jgi:hypothetical protein
MFCMRPLCDVLRAASGQVRDKLGVVWLVFVIPDADALFVIPGEDPGSMCA